MALKILTNGSTATSKSRNSIISLLREGGAEGVVSPRSELSVNSTSRAPTQKPISRAGNLPRMMRSSSFGAQSSGADDAQSCGSTRRAASGGGGRASTPEVQSKRALGGGRKQKSRGVLVTQRTSPPCSDVPHFGKMNVASVYGKRAQARLLLKDTDDMQALSTLNLALNDAEKVPAGP